MARHSCLILETKSRQLPEDRPRRAQAFYSFTMSKQVLLILGNQLFDSKYYKEYKNIPVFMAEAHELCTHFKYHKHKILLFLIAMRRYRDELQEQGFCVNYHELPEKESSYIKTLAHFLQDEEATELITYEIEDLFFEKEITKLANKLSIKLTILPSPFFMVSREDFKEYLKSVKAPLMKTFYERLRKQTGILMENGSALGGKYSYDSENRSKLPKDKEPPGLDFPKPKDIPYFSEVADLVEQNFSSHPGEVSNFWLATNREEAQKVFAGFLGHRLVHFGDYQDAITQRSDFVYHSVISPYLNMGLLTPQEVVSAVEEKYQKNDKIPLNAAEGFIRQVMGWREFVRGIYQNYDYELQKSNFFSHQEKLTPSWYEGSTGIPPLDDAIKKTIKYGYAHHIERLMILSNLMLLCEIHPQEVYRWFMELFVDSSDWVMGPNVFGMGQFSDGGIFATKPYMCGSNYLLKMSDYKKGDWCLVVDGLYWRFIEKNKEFFTSNHRLSMMVRTLEKMKTDHKEEIFAAAKSFCENNFQLKCIKERLL